MRKEDIRQGALHGSQARIKECREGYSSSSMLLVCIIAQNLKSPALRFIPPLIPVLIRGLLAQEPTTSLPPTLIWFLKPSPHLSITNSPNPPYSSCTPWPLSNPFPHPLPTQPPSPPRAQSHTLSTPSPHSLPPPSQSPPPPLMMTHQC